MHNLCDCFRWVLLHSEVPFRWADVPAFFCPKISVKLSDFSGGGFRSVGCSAALITPGGMRRHPHPSSLPGEHTGHLIKHCLGVAVPVYNYTLTQHTHTRTRAVRAAKIATLATNVNNVSTGGPPAAVAAAAFFALIYVICLRTVRRQFILSALIKSEPLGQINRAALVADRSQSSSLFCCKLDFLLVTYTFNYFHFCCFYYTFLYESAGWLAGLMVKHPLAIYSLMSAKAPRLKINLCNNNSYKLLSLFPSIFIF